VFGIIVLVLASLACGISGGAAPTQPPAAPPTQQVNTPVVEPPTSAPTVVQDTPTAEPPPATPTAESQQFFTDEFDNGVANWNPFVTNGELSQLDFAAKDSKLNFDLKQKQLWTYALYTPQTYTDVRIDTKVDNRGQNENNISLICRYDKERGWYEFSVANSGLYWIYFGKWDSNGSTASYAVIADGGSNNIKQGLAINTYGMTCKGNTISVYINDKEVKRVDDNAHGLREGQIGIGVSSFRRLPIEVEFDWVKISQP
jgi:hypothetical protein